MNTPLASLYLTVYRPLKLLGGSDKTEHQHEVALRHLDRYLSRKATASDLNDDTLTGFLTWLAKGRSPITANKSRLGETPARYGPREAEAAKHESSCDTEV